MIELRNQISSLRKIITGVMVKMKLGIDIDGVIVDTIRFCSEEFTNHFGYPVSCELIAHRFDDIKGGHEFLEENKEYLLCTMKPSEEAVQAVNALSREHDIYLISSRRQSVYEPTLNWLNKHEVAFKKLFLTSGMSKLTICKQLGIELFIEDSAVNASELAQYGIPVILYKTEYNIKAKHDLIVHCENWDEILKTVEEKSKI